MPTDGVGRDVDEDVYRPVAEAIRAVVEGLEAALGAVDEDGAREKRFDEALGAEGPGIPDEPG